MLTPLKPTNQQIRKQMSIKKLWHLIAKFHPEFPNLSVLARLALTSSVHTAGCERGFSVQNRILTIFRNRLTIENQQKLMRVKIYHADQIKKMKDQSSDKAILNKKEVFDFNAALLKWKVSKDRRIYELKKLK